VYTPRDDSVRRRQAPTTDYAIRNLSESAEQQIYVCALNPQEPPALAAVDNRDQAVAQLGASQKIVWFELPLETN